jgi:hypothetical protein
MAERHLTWDQFTRATTFLVGVVLLIVATIGTPARWGLVALALVLMGVITGEQFNRIIERRRNGRNGHRGAHAEGTTVEPPQG